MFKVKALLVLLMAAPVISQASSGNMSFAGSVDSSTCTVDFKNMTVEFTPRSVNEIQRLPNLGDIEIKPFDVSVSGCPQSLSKANLTVRFNEAPAGYGIMVPTNADHAKGMAVILRHNNKPIRPNVVNTEEIVSGAAKFDLTAWLYRQNSHAPVGSRTVTAGTQELVADLAMTFE